MPTNPVERAPVHDIGGTQDGGPWPKEMEEIAVDERIQRPVQRGEGPPTEVEVRVTDIRQILRESGEETDGYVISYHHSHD